MDMVAKAEAARESAASLNRKEEAVEGDDDIDGQSEVFVLLYFVITRV